MAGTFVALSLLLAACDKPSFRAGWELESDSQDFGWLMSGWQSPTGSRFVVGGSPDAGVIATDASGAWTPIAEVPDVPLLNWIHGFAADDIFVVGNEGTVLHYNGTSWELQVTPTTESLWGVWGAAPDDVWAVGGRGLPDSTPTLLHYDGTSWSSETLPTLSRPGVTALFKIWGTAADDVFAVGRFGTILHHDGNSWTEQASGTSDDLIALWGTGPDEIVAVGGRSNARVVVYDGAEWTSYSLAPMPGLNGVYMRTPGAAHIVGVEGTAAVFDLEALTFREGFPETDLDFHAVFGMEEGAITAVAGNFGAAAGDERGAAYVRALRDDE